MNLKPATRKNRSDSKCWDGAFDCVLSAEQYGIEGLMIDANMMPRVFIITGTGAEEFAVLATIEASKQARRPVNHEGAKR